MSLVFLFLVVLQFLGKRGQIVGLATITGPHQTRSLVLLLVLLVLLVVIPVSHQVTPQLTVIIDLLRSMHIGLGSGALPSGNIWCALDSCDK